MPTLNKGEGRWGEFYALVTAFDCGEVDHFSPGIWVVVVFLFSGILLACHDIEGSSALGQSFTDFLIIVLCFRCPDS
jgi:hypothetical protein